MEPSGYGLEDTKQMARMLEQAGVCEIDVMSGWHYASVPIIQTWVPQGAWAYLAEGVKQAVTIPVAAGTQIQDPLVAEQVLARGKADLVYMARALVADPELPNKAREGRLAEIRPCINCCRCISAVDSPPVYCSVNARTGRELQYPSETQAPTRKKVLVVGGGPAGMEAARIASRRGHRVTLCDRNPRLGGSLLLAAVTNRRLGPLLEYMRRETEKLPIDIRLNTTITPLTIDEMKPDALVLALGAAPSPLGVPGEDGNLVLDRNDMQAMLSGHSSNKWGFRDRARAFLAGGLIRYYYRPSIIRWLLRFGFPFKKRVAILGGGFAGCELAETLVDRGKRVAVIEESGRIGSDVEITHRWVLLQKLREAGVRMIRGARVTAITDAGVEIDCAGTSELVEADTVVKARASASDDFAGELDSGAVEVHRIGDGADPAKLLEAVASGFLTGQNI
jgi:2,4-dienoyl-CoA reductase (NADPH2)